jgi:6-phosphofructokinase 1
MATKNKPRQRQPKSRRIGIITAGGDSPGLNAAIRSVGKAALATLGMEIVGYRDGFRGLVEDLRVRLDKKALSGILTVGGTILGTGRDKPHRMLVDGEKRDMTDLIVENYEKNDLEALVCIGGGGTHKNALKLVEKGLNVITLPKTIDNDVALTDYTIGFDTALGIATAAIDRLHSTAHSHHRIVVAEIMGHRAGWLTLGAGIAGGADVVLIPEIPYDVHEVARAIRRRSRYGKNFSIVAVAEGAWSKEGANAIRGIQRKREKTVEKNKRKELKRELGKLENQHVGNSLELARQLEQLTDLESRVTILGYVQRGGIPSAGDRLLATRLGTMAVELIQEKVYGVMVAARGDGAEPVPIASVAGNLKNVPTNHPWVHCARNVGTCLGE